MITNKDVRVENGNLVLNGDKYPLGGQSPEAIMQIVEDNSDTTPTENSNNPVKSGGTWLALNRKCSVATYNWNLGSVTADGVYELNNFKSTVGLSGKNIVAVGLVSVSGSGNYDYGAAVVFRGDLVKIKTTLTQSNTTAYLYIIYTD